MEWCDLMLWQFPMWWFGLPATLKGWVDRTFALGRVYDGKHLYKQGRFIGKRALLSLTTGAPESAYRPDGMNGDIAKLLYPVTHGVLPFVGFTVLPPHIVYAPAHIGEDARTEALAAYGRYLTGIAAETA
ncbi:Glutathione-regulated potassium-efflux system ancillary protein KefG [bioreactor metagenome]|uniref:Glutathione-regulated potassium-efflux system ancillary protein KefG n=1 Tax=bioreactor metagenome TaxID=1076179 RepID=A0A645DVK6_9ZZZZ